MAVRSSLPKQVRASPATIYESETSSSLHNPLLRDKLFVKISQSDLGDVQLIETARPESLRAYDQIPMRPVDLLRQVKLIAPYLAGKSVAFVGDHDSTSLLLGLLSKRDEVVAPARMLLLDFDERLLVTARTLADKHGFGDRLDVRLYNVFEPVPSEFVAQFDWFYTNPPYGCYNTGESARLFITRGCELVTSDNAGGCVILPDDEERPWTRSAMYATQKFLCDHGWTVDEKINQLHKYYLDDDQELASSVILARQVGNTEDATSTHYTGRRVDFDEIPNFYGRSVQPPYPRFIQQDGTKSYDWT